MKGRVGMGVVIMIVCIACRHSSDPMPVTVPVVSDTTFHPSYSVTGLKTSSGFQAARRVGTIQDQALDEISGIGCSVHQPHALWMEEDSGNENKIYLLDSSGSTLATFRMSSVDDRDWEDLSVAPGPVKGISYIYLAETGDNKLAYPIKYIYRFPEPVLSGLAFPYTGEIGSVEKIALQYPDGIKNAEAVMVDPVTLDIYIISKEDEAVVYVARFPQQTDKVNMMIKLGTLPFSTVTAADISPDGTEILIKNYTDILYWKKEGSERIDKTLQRTPVKVPYTPEQKGESVCWSPDGLGYYTTSEHPQSDVSLPVYFYARTK